MGTYLRLNASHLGKEEERGERSEEKKEGEENNLIDFDNLNSSAHAYDLIYNPGKTTFLRHAEKNGCTVQNGLKMLIHQAAQSFNLWHDTMPEIHEDLMSVLGVN